MRWYRVSVSLSVSFLLVEGGSDCAARGVTARAAVRPAVTACLLNWRRVTRALGEGAGGRGIDFSGIFYGYNIRCVKRGHVPPLPAAYKALSWNSIPRSLPLPAKIPIRPSLLAA